ncbi:MAG: PKD domain-containing protein [Candidatus Omnitrophica bacterium]|nr:PKD domain-containing protein [Candidatus Omnitrophota bacterium]
MPNKSGAKNHGQSTVEFALIIISFLLLIMGIADFTRALMIRNTLNQAAREGVREAVTFFDLVDNDPRVMEVMQDILDAAGISDDELKEITLETQDYLTGEPIKATVTAGYRPFFSRLIPGVDQVQLVGMAVMRHEIANIIIPEPPADDDDDDDDDDDENNIPPIAVLTADPLSGSVLVGVPNRDKLNVHFDGSKSVDPDGGSVEYSWNVDDDYYKEGGATLDYKFSVGTYYVILTVTDVDRATDSARVDITVKAAPPETDDDDDDDDANTVKACFTAIPESGNAPLTVQFSASCSTGPITNYDWVFGDGNSNFGTDVNTSNIYNVGTYQVTLTVSNEDATSSTSKTIYVREPGVDNKPPKARINAYPLSGTADLKVEVDAYDSEDEDGKIVAYAWTFGNGKTGSGVTANTVYTSGGLYTITLTVYDNEAAYDTATTTIDVEDLKITPD